MCLTLILHADDFGLNTAVTEGILRGFDFGLLTSTSLLANAPGAKNALRAWQQRTRERDEHVLPFSLLRDGLDDPGRPFDLGVHLNLTQGRPLTADQYPAELLDREGRFPGIWRLFARLGNQRRKFLAAIAAELAAQIEFVIDHGLRPTHLNGHQYVEMLPTVADVLPELQARFEISVLRVASEPALTRTTLWHDFRPHAWLVALVKRHYARQLGGAARRPGASAPQVYFGTAHAGRINAEMMELFLDHAGRDGTVEIGMHPGLQDDSIRPHEISDGWMDPLADLRADELELLESPTLARRLRFRGVRLGRLAELSTQQMAA